MATPIICHGCGATGSVGQVTASLICKTCGHGEDLDLDYSKTAAGPNESAGGKGDTGWDKQQPNVLEGWDEYSGPAVGANPLAGEHMVGDLDAYNDGDWSRGNPGYNPGGGYDNAPRHLGPTTGIPPIEQWDEHRGPDSGGARWQGKQSSIPLHVTLPDGTEWEGAGRIVNSTLKAPKKKVAVKKTSQLDKMVAKIKESNPGILDDEAVSLAKASIRRWVQEN